MGFLSRLFGRESPPPIDPAWRERDEVLFARLRALLGGPMPAPAEMEDLGARDLLGGPRDLGFGARHTGGTIMGGTTNAHVGVVTFGEKIARLRVVVSFTRGASEGAIEALREACGDRFSIRGEGPTRIAFSERCDDGVEAALHAARADALGPPVDPQVPESLRPAFEELTGLGPGFIEVGAVGVAARPARNPIVGIVAAGRIDLLRAILRGPSPEGRVQAASALLAAQFAGLLDDEDRRAIRAIRASTIPIMVMSGCMPMPTQAAALIPAPPE